MMIERLTREAFEKHLNRGFRIGSERATVEAELIECRKLRSGEVEEGNREPFSVLFRGPMEPVLPQRIYRVEGDGMGPMELFLVPIGPDKMGMRYEAVFT